ncbi:hypothetical protein BM525_20540 (plasmid) [Alteromonas mediterranea]|uniref:Uncharacterized protein n=1 Tax=Alteromonas mediterranea TaxID=314275 RepID=A0AAC9JGS0_9ALTE|nr:hypothetical protein [Alteromonas mediterranea]APD92261.1 hypothetical protein BM524_20345 [Alteromonas mediterranea]APE00116.1 hypothetical protein BM525_20540 [Alteromonas mediterranea]
MSTKITSLSPFLILRYLTIFIALICGIGSCIEFFRLISGNVTLFDVAAPASVSIVLFALLYATRDNDVTQQQN